MIIKACKVCKKEFRAKENRINCCSRECADISRRKKRPPCEHCGKPVKKVHSRFCSASCSSNSRDHAKWNRHGPKGYPVGSKRKHASGYVFIKVGTEVPGTDKTGWMFEHRYVAQKTLDRPLESYERVHHKDGDRTNNSPENLEVWKKKDPYGVRNSDYHCPGCLCLGEVVIEGMDLNELRLYAQGILLHSKNTEATSCAGLLLGLVEQILR